MVDELLRYDRMVDQALRGVVRDALLEVAEKGLPGSHHFYITFSTRHPGVALPDFLSGQYPDEMTIVLQYQYYGLEIAADHFAVTLSFNNQHHRLVIPFLAISTFADPSVNFVLQFQDLEPAASLPGKEEPAGRDAAEEPADPAPAASTAAGDRPASKVVSLDVFRKK